MHYFRQFGSQPKICGGRGDEVFPIFIFQVNSSRFYPFWENRLREIRFLSPCWDWQVDGLQFSSYGWQDQQQEWGRFDWNNSQNFCSWQLYSKNEKFISKHFPLHFWTPFSSLDRRSTLTIIFSIICVHALLPQLLIYLDLLARNLTNPLLSMAMILLRSIISIHSSMGLVCGTSWIHKARWIMRLRLPSSRRGHHSFRRGVWG